MRARLYNEQPERYGIDMRITRWGEYGILCSLYLAKKAKEHGSSDQAAVGAAEIGETQGIPIQYTQQILQRLRKGDIIKSVRGPHGGYQLSRSPEETNLKDVLNAAEGATFEIICDTNPVYADMCESGRACALRGVWHDLKSAVDALLEQRTLAMLLELQTDDVFPNANKLVPGPTAHLSTEAVLSEVILEEN